MGLYNLKGTSALHLLGCMLKKLIVYYIYHMVYYIYGIYCHKLSGELMQYLEDPIQFCACSQLQCPFNCALGSILLIAGILMWLYIQDISVGPALFGNWDYEPELGAIMRGRR
jgi:hypothetical protein